MFTPRYEGARGDCYPFSGEGRLDPVLGGLIARPTAHNTMVTPAGFDTFGLVENHGLVLVGRPADVPRNGRRG